MGINWFSILSYFLNVKYFLIKNIQTLDINKNINSPILTFFVCLGIYLFIQIAITLIFVPEKLRYPSYIGCLIYVICLLTFWYLNLLVKPNNFNGMRPFINGNYTALVATCLFGMEGTTSFFAIRSSMQKKSSFYIVRPSFIIIK